MKMTNIYQTLENRNNIEDILEHGPYFCSIKDENGNDKKGIREPWLGEGYYFWDSRIEDAKWWGETAYKKSGYIICETQYDQHSDLLFDTVGDMSHMDILTSTAKILKGRLNQEKIAIPSIISFLKKNNYFPYKAIRVYPDPKYKSQTDEEPLIVFPGEKTTFLELKKVQICFFDKTLLTEPISIAYQEDKTTS